MKVDLMMRAITAFMLLSIGSVMAGETIENKASTMDAQANDSLESARNIHIADTDGTLQVPSFRVPFSSFASAEARQLYIFEHSTTFFASPVARMKTLPVTEQRKILDDHYLKPLIKKALKRFPVNIEPLVIRQVYTELITPESGVPEDKENFVLINLHGGGFTMGARTNGQLESIPVAGLGKYRVISVDYRQGPENHFPAASEDVATVYKELLKTYRPEHIGIFGCSAGGLLAAQAVAWFQNENLPAPGAIGIFCASAGRLGEGDSAYTASALNGQPVPPPGSGISLSSLAYFDGIDMHDRLVSPIEHVEVIAKFPPVLIITATRDFAMSSAINTHREFIKVGVDADLHVWDGLQHFFFGDVDLPESKEAFDVMVDFFDRHLKKN